MWRPNLPSWPVPDAVAELARRLAEALQIRSRRQTLEEELHTAETDLKTAERAVEQAVRDLEALAGGAGVSSVEELPEVERRAARAVELRTQLPELELQITEAGQAPLSELIERADGVDVDSLDAEVAEAEERHVATGAADPGPRRATRRARKRPTEDGAHERSR